MTTSHRSWGSGSKYGEAASNSPLQATAKSTPRLSANALGLSGGARELLEGNGGIAYRARMATTVERLAAQALKLPSASRARLADLLVESLDAGELGRIDRLWTAEAKRRRDEVRTGRVKTIPGDQARRKVRNAVRR